MYEFHVTLSADYPEAMAAVRDALMAEHLGVVSDVDAQAVFKAKLGKDIPPYHVLGACNPALADRLLAVEPNAGTLLPCNVVVREDEPGKVVVSFMDPAVVLALSGAPEAQAVAADAKARLERVAAALAGRAG